MRRRGPVVFGKNSRRRLIRCAEQKGASFLRKMPPCLVSTFFWLPQSGCQTHLSGAISFEVAWSFTTTAFRIMIASAIVCQAAYSLRPSVGTQALSKSPRSRVVGNCRLRVLMLRWSTIVHTGTSFPDQGLETVRSIWPNVWRRSMDLTTR